MSTKPWYQAYLRAAQDVAGLFPEQRGARVVANPHAAVQMVEDGAFVEALIWVPVGAIDPETLGDPRRC